MKKKKTHPNKFAGLGILSAIAASLCCITPVLALISGGTSAVSAFSWMAPYRPWLIGITVAVLAFAWYQKLKAVAAEEIECDCNEDEEPSFWQSKKFLGIITILAILMLAIPYYPALFYSQSPQKEVIIVRQHDIQTLHLQISGMDCFACNSEVTHAVFGNDGVIEAKADYKTGSALIKFDKSRSSAENIIRSVNATGYKVTGHTLEK
jgi:mercuric ion transport protein